MAEIESMADEIFAELKGYVADEITPVVKRVEAVEKREPVVVKGGKGDPGERGEPGEKGERGADGASGEKGEKGDPGERGEPGPAGERGEKGEPGERGEKGEPGIIGKDGRDGRDGKDGSPGKDASQIEYLDGIDESKSYPRGTHALYRGGVIVALRATDPLDDDLTKSGWAVAMNGIASESEESLDDGRTIKRTTFYTNGKSAVREHKTSVLIYRGVFKSDVLNERGDVVTWDGCSWHCEQPTKDKPGEKSSAWKLMVKRGSHAKDAYMIACDNGFKGSVKQWLESLRGPKGDDGRPGMDSIRR